MKYYKYTALNSDKKKIKGVLSVRNEQELKNAVRAKELFLISFKEMRKRRSTVLFFSKKVSVGEFSLFCREFSIMLNSGVRVSDCLETLRKQQHSADFRKALYSVHEMVLAGKALDEAFGRFPAIFPSYFVNMVRVGIMGGVLPNVLESSAIYYENEDKIKKKLTTALAYPMFLVALLTVVCIAVVGFVVPTFKEAIDDLGIESVPALTQSVFNVSDFLRSYYLIIASVFLMISVVLIAISKTDSGKRFFDKTKLKLPLFKNILVNIITARFSMSVGLLLENGTDILSAFENSAILLGNVYAKEKVFEAAEGLKKGHGVASILKETGLFSDIFIQMIAVGEKSGSMAKVLRKCSGHFEAQSEQAINRMFAVIQPLLLLVIGAVTAVVFASVYSPIMGMMNGM